MATTEVTVLSRADWERIQSSLNKPQVKKYTRQEMAEMVAEEYFIIPQQKRRDAILKLGIGAKLKAEREAYYDNLAAEEVEMKKQDRQQALDEANQKSFHQKNKTRKFDSAIRTTLVLKENDALVKFKQEKQRIAKERQRQSEEEMRCRRKEAQRQEQEKARQRKLSNQALANCHIEQIKEKKQLRELERHQEKEERDRLRDLDKLQTQEKKHQDKKNVEEKYRTLKCRQSEINDRNCIRKKEAEKLNMEEKERKHRQTDTEKKLLERKKDQEERFRKRQIPINIVTDKLAASKKEQAATMAQREAAQLSKVVAERDAKAAKQRRDNSDKRAAMLKSISVHRERKIQEKAQKQKAEQQSNQEWFQVQKMSDRLFLEQEKRKAKTTSDNKIKCCDFNVNMVAEKHARLEQLKKKECDAAKKNADQIAESEKQFEQYVQQELHKAADSQRNVKPLLTVTRGHHYGKEDLYSSINNEPLPRLATDQTRFMKRCVEGNNLQLSMVDRKSFRLPPLAKATKLKSNVAERSTDCSKDRGESSNRLGNSHFDHLPQISRKSQGKAQTPSTKQYSKRDMLQLTYVENCDVYEHPAPLPPISMKQASSKKSNVSLKQTLPPITTKGCAGSRNPPGYVKGPQYHCMVTGELLPKLGTAQTRSIKKRQEHGNLLHWL